MRRDRRRRAARARAAGSPATTSTSSTAAPPARESVANALAAVETELVAIHDAARPLVTPGLVDALVGALDADPEAAGVIAAAPVTDTIKQAVARDRVSRSSTHRIARRLWAAQTPQVFRAEALRAALEVDAAVRDAATDEAMLVEAAGGRVLIHPVAGAEPQGDDAARPAGRRAAAGRARQLVEQDPDQGGGEAELADPEGDAEGHRSERRGERRSDGEGEREEQQLTSPLPLQSRLQSDADRLPPAPAPRRDGHAAGALLHGRERRALPGRRERGRDRGAGRLRARLPLHARRSSSGATRSGRAAAATTSTPTASSSAARRCGSASSATSSPAPRTAPRTLLEARDFDYVVGSVHFIGERRAVDHDGWDVWEGSGDADEVWRRYFEALAECARSGLFDILAHPDLVKVWGGARPLPERDPRLFYEPAVEAIAESGIAVEISTAGLRKPVGELYPAPAFAEMCVEAGAPFALSSDAHLPEQVGFGYDRARRVPRRARGGGDLRLRAAPAASSAPLPAVAVG